MGTEAKQIDATDSEPEPELPEAEPKDESHEEKRDPDLVFDTYAKTSHGTGPISDSKEGDHEQAKRQAIVPIPAVVERDDGGIKTHHEMEDVDLEVARIQPKLPTFPSESDLPAHHHRVRDATPMPLHA
jgi:hypothetical protein